MVIYVLRMDIFVPSVEDSDVAKYYLFYRDISPPMT